MCGILTLVKTPWKESAKNALETLYSRGPNEQNILDLGDVQLCHTRLSIIDLSSGSQPMTCKNNRFSINFNGEIYNFQELKSELHSLGFSFVTRSDTEVLLVGWQAWGTSLLKKLDGMFSFTIWDAKEHTLFACRDPIGIKPLFYSTYSGLVVASTLAPFYKFPNFPRTINYEAMRDYLASQACYAPHSFLNEVKQLPPATWLKYDAGPSLLETGSYWSIPKATTDDSETLLAKVDAAIKESVRRQLIADVPLGAFLSGGIDSSLMVHYTAELGVHSLKTFSFKFKDEKFDESMHAKAVAQRYGCDHHILEAPHIDGQMFKSTIEDLDQPLADPSFVMTHALSRLAKSHVTVAISGDGGDELFGGYQRFLDTETINKERFGQNFLRKCVETNLLPGALLRRTLFGKELLLYRRVELGPWTKGRKNMHQYLDPSIHETSKSASTMEVWQNLLGDVWDTDSLMRADLWTYLAENCLVKTDRASMSHGLEVRVPLLGKPVLDLALNLSASVHFEGSSKALLTKLAKRNLPQTVWDRPKHGFSIPLLQLFRGPWRDVCEDALSQIDTIAPFLNKKAITTLWKSTLLGKGSRRLAYTFIVLLLWLSKNKV